MPINPNFSQLEAVITAKVNTVAANIDNKDLLIQMKALEAAVANLALTRVIAEGTYQQGQITTTATAAASTLNTTVSNANTSLGTVVSTATSNLNTAASTALSTFNTSANATIAQIDALLATLGSVNAQQVVDSVTAGVATITTAANNATTAINNLQSSAISAIGTAATNSLNSAVASINTTRDTAIAAVGASGNLQGVIDFVRNDRWLGLNIFAPTNYT